MLSKTSLDAFEDFILSQSDPLGIALWKAGSLQIEDLFYIFVKRVERQNCSHNQSYLADISQVPSTMLNGNLANDLTTNNVIQSHFNIRPVQAHVIDPTSVLPLNMNQELFYMNKPKGSNLSSEIQVVIGHNTNENPNILPNSNTQEGCVNDSIIQETADDVSVGTLGSPTVEVEALYESRDARSSEVAEKNSQFHENQDIIASIFGDSGSPLSPTSSIPDTNSCPYCGHTSNRHYNLHAHILTHLDRVKDFTCPVCLDNFYRLSDMRHHYNSRHLRLRYACFCGKRFSRKCGLKKHKEKEHNSGYN